MGDGNVVDEVILEWSVGKDAAHGCGFADVVDEEFETFHHSFAQSDEFWVFTEGGDISLGELREDLDGLGMGDQHPFKNKCLFPVNNKTINRDREDEAFNVFS